MLTSFYLHCKLHSSTIHRMSFTSFAQTEKKIVGMQFILSNKLILWGSNEPLGATATL